MTSWNCKTGDYHRRISITLTDLSTAGASGVTFRMRLRDGGPLVVNAAGTIDSATQVSYQFTGTQLDVAGYYLLEITLTYAGDGSETAPTSGQVSVIIEPRLAAS